MITHPRFIIGSDFYLQIEVYVQVIFIYIIDETLETKYNYLNYVTVFARLLAGTGRGKL